jgi:hypothetical protein
VTVEAVLLQDGDAISLQDPDPDLVPLEGIGALLRF